jgi:hypothetical protein
MMNGPSKSSKSVSGGGTIRNWGDDFIIIIFIIIIDILVGRPVHLQIPTGDPVRH